ncbi:Alpha/Beta hydrolase protein [Boletus edulis BED1]|uniref:Alpha/Beta hydrolase protein n=1 Tax=Boletus edulis BED1 TaxID=1328754 RepID=A0AAD4BS45_BOLED|nr:Alpha/Beta hydrolase protein [Boletus edulis BED1]
MDLRRFQDLNQLQPRYTLCSRVVTLGDRDGLQTHLIEAFPSTASEPVSLPLILLLHGFPELAYSWRKVLGPLSASRRGYHVIAPDLRGYGRTVTQHDIAPNQIQYDDPIAPFHLLNIAKDVCSLVKTLGHDSVALLVGHDFGSPVAGHCVTTHPDLFRAVVFMSVPFVGVGQPPQPHRPNRGDGAENTRAKAKSLATLAQAVSTPLAALTPPRKHYTSYFATRDANTDMLGDSDEDLYRFLGGYYHMKSGAWEGNTMHPLPSASNPTIDAITRDLATLPDYYVMPAHENMRQVIERHASQHPHTHFTWASEDAEDGRVYASEFARTGFQGGLNYYRSVLSPPPAELEDELIALVERQVGVPAAFVSGARDWGVHQTPGALEKMRHRFGMQSDDVVLIERAGHWVQQEAPDRVIEALLQFLEKVEGTSI